MMFSRGTPRTTANLAQAMAEAPAPETTTRSLPISLPCSFTALISAAPEMMAVPCWSSWKTGMFMLFLRVSSM